jgi:uncharacterized membrane protein YgcG
LAKQQIAGGNFGSRRQSHFCRQLNLTIMKKHILILLTTLFTGAFLAAQNEELPKVRVLFAYNNLAKNQLINDSYNPIPENQIKSWMETKMVDHVTNSNLVLENSGIQTFQWEAAGLVEIPVQFPYRSPAYGTGGKLADDFDFLRNNPDAKEFILNAAGTASADQIFVFSCRADDAGGLASEITLEYPASFANVSLDYSTTTHEWGHNLQANHSRDTPDTLGSLHHRGPEAYNFGHKIDPYNTEDLISDSFRQDDGTNSGSQPARSIGTIMSYGNDLPYFSNPQLQITATSQYWFSPNNDGYGYYIITGTHTYHLGVPQGTPDTPDVTAAIQHYMETGTFIAPTSGTYGAADNARVLRQTGPILAAMHDDMKTPHVISSTLSYKPGSYADMEGSYGPGYLEAIVVASGENLKATWTQSGSQKIARTDDNFDTAYSVDFQPYDWTPDYLISTGLPGRDTFTFRSNNTTQPVAVTISNPLGSASLVLTPTTGTSSGTGGGNTGGGTTGGSNSGSGGGGGGGAPSFWMLLGLAILAACRGNRKTGSP